MKFTLLIPTLNEIDGMKVIMPQVPREIFDQIILIDGGSTDGTIEYARSLGLTIYEQSRPGMINAYRDIYPLITGDAIVTFSPDGNCPPEYLLNLTERMREGYDMIIVSRYLPPASSKDDTVITAFGNFMFTFLINLLFGGRYTDAMTNYRAYTRALPIDLSLMDTHRFSVEQLFHVPGWEPLMSIRAAKAKLRLLDIPGDEPKRIGGVGKSRPLPWGAIYILEIIQELIFWTVRHTPTKLELFDGNSPETKIKSD